MTMTPTARLPAIRIVEIEKRVAKRKDQTLAKGPIVTVTEIVEDEVLPRTAQNGKQASTHRHAIRFISVLLGTVVAILVLVAYSQPTDSSNRYATVVPGIAAMHAWVRYRVVDGSVLYPLSCFFQIVVDNGVIRTASWIMKAAVAVYCLLSLISAAGLLLMLYLAKHAFSTPVNASSSEKGLQLLQWMFKRGDSGLIPR